MSDWLIYDLATGAELRRVSGAAGQPGEGEGAALVPASALVAPPLTAWHPASRSWADVPPPKMLRGLDILALFRPAQHARAARMLFAVYPPEHPQAGELVDPDAMTQRLIDATLALHEPIPVTSEFHVNGTAWMRAIGVIESDEEAARILAGIRPEEL